jgi:hypothetical protein
VTPVASNLGAPSATPVHESAAAPSAPPSPMPISETLDDVGTVVDTTTKAVEETLKLPVVPLPTVTTPALPVQPVELPSSVLP